MRLSRIRGTSRASSKRFIAEGLGTLAPDGSGLIARGGRLGSRIDLGDALGSACRWRDADPHLRRLGARLLYRLPAGSAGRLSAGSMTTNWEFAGRAMPCPGQ